MILLDTHVLVHYANGDRKIGRRARAVIDRARSEEVLYVSAISFWEITMLHVRGRLKIQGSPSVFAQKP